MSVLIADFVEGTACHVERLGRVRSGGLASAKSDRANAGRPLRLRCRPGVLMQPVQTRRPPLDRDDLATTDEVHLRPAKIRRTGPGSTGRGRARAENRAPPSTVFEYLMAGDLDRLWRRRQDPRVSFSFAAR
jgi:hypothetical protein